ncbi:MAG: aryl-sulfate sulfotransferase [Thermodesulfobacteriota bacterium]
MSFARRGLQSLTEYKPEKTYNGFTLFSPMTMVPSNTFLIDMKGRFVHRWKLPGWVRIHAELLLNGNLLFGLADPAQRNLEIPFAGGGVFEMDWEGKIVWSYEDKLLDCHDRVRLRNGNTLVASYRPVPEKIAKQLTGGRPGTELKGGMLSYALQEITREGKVAWEWIAYDHLDPVLDNIPPERHRIAWPGWNSYVELPDGNIMACSYNLDNIMILDRTTGGIKWRWGQGIISMPHDPSMLDNGNILVLDNNRWHMGGSYWPPDGSRVVEVNPETKEIVWEFKEENPVDFYTTYIGGCQRLPNGNTLICEGATGRLFEVTPRGEMVWEYIVPFYARKDTLAPYGLSNCTYRCFRYGPDYPGLQGKMMDTGDLDLWNRLYGPEAFWPGPRPSWIGTGTQSSVAGDLPPRSQTARLTFDETKPSVEDPTVGKKVDERLKQLGY